jgi:hypothetical protein
MFFRNIKSVTVLRIAMLFLVLASLSNSYLHRHYPENFSDGVTGLFFGLFFGTMFLYLKKRNHSDLHEQCR